MNLLTVLNSIFSIADVYCKLLPLVRPYLTEPLLRLNDREVVTNCLVEPIPRNLFDQVLGEQKLSPVYAKRAKKICFLNYAESGKARELMSELQKRRTLDKLGGGRASYFSTAGHTEPSESPPRRSAAQMMGGSAALADSTFDALTKKLHGLSESVEDHLLALGGLFNRTEPTKRK